MILFATYYFFGLSLKYFFDSLILFCLYSAFFIDIKYRIVPDSLIVFVGAIALIFWPINPYLTSTLFMNIILVLAGGGLAFSLSFLLYYIGQKVFGKDAFGGGDVKLFTALGLLFGYKSILFLLWGSFLISAVFCILIAIKTRSLKSNIAFVPFVCITAVLYMYFKPYIIASFI
ncbi:prepilin peptidase [bacterium]